MQYFPRGGEAQHQIRSDGPLLALLLVTALLIVSATPRDDDVSFFMLDGPSFQLDKTLACLDLDRRSGLFVDSEHPGAERPAMNLGALWIYHALRSHPRRVDDAEKGDVVYIPMEPNLAKQMHKPRHPGLQPLRLWCFHTLQSHLAAQTIGSGNQLLCHLLPQVWH